MKNLFTSQKGFTLVELMITIVIIGILAAVAVPIYQSQINRAKASEADAALGTIRTALRVYYAENSTYPKQGSFKKVTAIGIGITATALNGKYFQASDYTYKSKDGKTYEIRATGSGAQKGINRKMNEKGDLTSF